MTTPIVHENNIITEDTTTLVTLPTTHSGQLTTVPSNAAPGEYAVEEFGSVYLSLNPGSGITYLVLMAFIMVSGTLGNVLVISAILTSKKLRTIGNMFIVNLAMADLCVTGFVDPFTIVGFLYGQQYFIDRPILCEFVASICLTSCFCSLLSIGAISVNRYVHIVYHHHYNVIYTRNHSIAIVIGLWIVSFLLEMGCFMGWGDHVYDKKTMACVYDRTADYSFTLFFASVGVGCPLLIIAICYTHIYIFVWLAKKKIHNGMSNVSRPKSSDMKLVGTVLMIVTIFILCWIPYVFVILYDFGDVLPPVIHTYVVMIAHANSSFNYILYGITNLHFRQAYMRVLHLDTVANWWRKRRGGQVGPDVDGVSLDVTMTTGGRLAIPMRSLSTTNVSIASAY